VLCPLSTLSQWHQEISDKSQEGALRVAEFYGANRQSFTAASLADYDIGTRHDQRHDSGQGSLVTAPPSPQCSRPTERWLVGGRPRTTPGPLCAGASVPCTR
jgi:hypothetical protein